MGSGSDIDSAFLMTICDQQETDEQGDVSKGKSTRMCNPWEAIEHSRV